MPILFKIPKLTDKDVVAAFFLIKEDAKSPFPLKVMVYIPVIGDQEVGENWEVEKNNSDLHFLLAQNSAISPKISLRGAGNRNILQVQRSSEEPSDNLTYEDDWRNHVPEDKANALPKLVIRLTALARKHLKAAELDASLLSDHATAWSKYRSAQTNVLNSLQQTAEQIIVDVANKNAEVDKLRAQRFDELEVKLRAELAAERESLTKQHEKKTADLQSRIKAHEEREAQFQTKEARYVSRQKQDEQIKQIQEWLNNWALTKGTTQKRWPVTTAYIVALAFTGAVTIYATVHNYELIKTTDDLAKLAWWQWVALASKSFFPLAAFTTFMVYLIRWDSAWARQHSEEEFRNRTRLIDIGRAGWLLEAVRDAHEKDAEIPTDLLRELSRNLFSNASSSDGDIHPSAISDVMLQGLTSLRVKTSDGSEVEASRAKSKK